MSFFSSLFPSLCALVRAMQDVGKTILGKPKKKQKTAPTVGRCADRKKARAPHGRPHTFFSFFFFGPLAGKGKKREDGRPCCLGRTPTGKERTRSIGGAVFSYKKGKAKKKEGQCGNGSTRPSAQFDDKKKMPARSEEPALSLFLYSKKTFFFLDFSDGNGQVDDALPCRRCHGPRQFSRAIDRHARENQAQARFH